MASLKCGNRAQRLTLLSAVAIGAMLAGNVLRACPFCLSPPMTLVKEIANSDIAVIVELLKFEVVQKGAVQIPQSTVRIREFLQGAEYATKFGPLQSGQPLVLSQEIAGAPGDLFLLLGSLPSNDSSTESTFATNTEAATSSSSDEASSADSGGGIVTADLKSTESVSKRIQRTSFLIPELISWDPYAPVSREAIRYIKNAPGESVEQVQRLPYFMKFLENPDPLLSIDAWAEFANATYDDVKAVKDRMPREQLRQWIADPMMTPERLGLYGMMLGLCGNADDAVFLEKQIGAVPPTGKDEKEFFRYGTDGLMGGYLLLTGEDGVAFLEQTRLKPGVPTDSVHAAVQAIQFIWSYESSLIPQSRLKSSMRRLLSNNDLRILTITNLARWKDWECWPELEQIFRNESADDRATQKAIVQFAEECRKATTADGSVSDMARAADKFLAQAEV
ncbi:MAG: hypothetical protein H7Z17_20800, partial [Fuerstia sp.]|nr:hypothetical protein [Fuerstiella sp.]